MRDTDAAIKELKAAGPVGIIGFCMGGTIAFLAATRLSGLSAAVGYYGGRIVAFADEKPKCPTQLHFGEKDASIPMTDVEIIKQKRGGDCEIYVYPDGRPRLPLRRARQLPQGEPRSRLAAHHRILRQAHEEVSSAHHFNALRPRGSPRGRLLLKDRSGRDAGTRLGRAMSVSACDTSAFVLAIAIQLFLNVLIQMSGQLLAQHCHCRAQERPTVRFTKLVAFEVVVGKHLGR